jgi:hypothetical protein
MLSSSSTLFSLHLFLLHLISGSPTPSSSSTNPTSSISNTTSSISNTTQPNLTLTTTSSSTLPLITLPYATYQPTHNASFSFYKYSNIRYAAAPNGTLRFRNPVAPTVIEEGVQDGSYDQTCYQLEQGTNSGAKNQGED